MIEINNEFWIVGTSVDCYFRLFKKDFNKLSLGQKIMIIDEKTILIIDDFNSEKNKEYQFSSKSKMNQSLVSWQSLGFFAQIDESKTYIKIIEPIYDDDFLFNYTKTKILEVTKNKLIQKYRNSILLKCIYLINNKFIENMKIVTKQNKDNFNYKKIEKEISLYEKKLLDDKTFKELISIKILEKNNE